MFDWLALFFKLCSTQMQPVTPSIISTCTANPIQNQHLWFKKKHKPGISNVGSYMYLIVSKIRFMCHYVQSHNGETDSNTCAYGSSIQTLKLNPSL